MIEAQKTLEVHGAHFHFNQSLAQTFNLTRFYDDVLKTVYIVRAVIRFEKRATSYTNIFEKHLTALSDFIALFDKKDIQSENRQEIVDEIKNQLQLLNENIEQIDEITVSDKMKILINERRDMEMHGHALALYYKRYYNHDEQERLWTYKYVDLTYRIVYDLEHQFADKEWPILTINALTKEMQSRFDDLIMLLKNVAKDLVPRD